MKSDTFHQLRRLSNEKESDYHFFRNFDCYYFNFFTQDYNLNYNSDNIEKCGAIYDSNETLLAYSEGKKRRYSNDNELINSMSFILGDTSDSVKSGVQSVYIEELLNTNRFKEAFGIDKFCKANDIFLSIDGEANKVAYEAMRGYNGVVLVYNYKTGQLLCDVSKPSESISDLMNKGDVLTDKSINGLFVPGSVMKIVTASCILKNPGIVPEKFTCTGSLTCVNDNVSCKKAHGELGLKEALNVSCNCWFGNAAIALGEERLKKMPRNSVSINNCKLKKTSTSRKVFLYHYQMIKSN